MRLLTCNLGLLQGSKRFVLYPPAKSELLYPHGVIDAVHPNGLISYQHFPVRADGLSTLDAAENYLDIAEAKIRAAKERGAKPDVIVAHRKEQKKAQKMYMAAGGGKEVDSKPSKAAKGASKDSDIKGKSAEWGGLEDETSPSATSAKTEEEPSSFSHVPTAALHAQLGLSTSASTSTTSQTYPNIAKAGSPFIVELKQGQMLYLPASWWHEVTSISGTDTSQHMAFNYWFHPPDGLKNFEEPYEDAVLWRHLRKIARKTMVSVKPKAQLKRKRIPIEDEEEKRERSKPRNVVIRGSNIKD